MNGLAFKDRPYDLFISYSHRDRERVAPIARWLQDHAQVKVWWDERNLEAGARLETALPGGLTSARGVLFAVSQGSAESGWVQNEFALAVHQRAQNPEYRILCLSLDGTQPPDMALTTLWITVPATGLDPAIAAQLLGGLYGEAEGRAESRPGGRELFVSRSWRSAESTLADAVCRRFMRAGYRLVGDAEEQVHTDRDARMRSLIASCGALLAVAPNRAGSGRTWKAIEEEVEIAVDLGVPALVVAEPGVALNPRLSERLAVERLFAIDPAGELGDAVFTNVVETMAEEFRPPRRRHFVFFATSLQRNVERTEQVRRLVQQVTGVDCVLGKDLGGESAQSEIIERIQTALFVIADISEENLNAQIEAGIARGADTRLYPIAAGEPRQPHFIFRDLEIEWYDSDTTLLGIVHRIARRYRRRILNRELAGKQWF